MTEKQRSRRASFIESLQALRTRTFSRRQNRPTWEQHQIGNRRDGRVFSLDSSYIPTTNHCFEPAFQSNEARSHRQVSMPLPPTSSSSLKPDNGPKIEGVSRGKSRILRLTSRAYPASGSPDTKSQFQTGKEALGDQKPDTTSNGMNNPYCKEIQTLPLRKVRVGNHIASRQQQLFATATHQQLAENSPQPPAISIRDMANTTPRAKSEVKTKTLRWTNGFENLRSNDIPTNKKSQRNNEPTQTVTALNLNTNPAPSEQPRPPTAVTTIRSKERTERMVLPRRYSNSSTISRIPRSKNHPLTATLSSVLQVSEAKPPQYWLGRFVTLTNGFYYEDSFNEPNITTGFGMLSSYSRPLTHPDTDLTNYRIKRAFMVLEKVCVTEDATASLRKFRDEYIVIYGDRWML